MKKTVLVAAAALAASVMTTAPGVALAQDDTQAAECTASDRLLYAADVNGFVVQSDPINFAGVEMSAQEDGLHISKSPGVADAEVVFMSTTVENLVRRGVPASASGPAFTNLWFDTELDGSYFDLGADGTGRFGEVGGDDYAALVGGKLRALGGPNAAAIGQGANAIADLPVVTAGKISGNTPVAIVVGTIGSEVVVQSVGGVRTVSCSDPEPTPTPTPTPTEEPEPTETPDPTTTPPADEEAPLPEVDLDCRDFPLADGRTAQDVLNLTPTSDPHGLDADQDRIACEPGQDTAPDGGDIADNDEPVGDVAVPSGGVATGAGPA